MTSRSRSDDLAADLLNDIAAEEAAPSAPASTSRPKPKPTPKTEATSPAEIAEHPAFVETELFLAPRTWRRPGIAFAGKSLSISAGPVRVNLGRR